MTLIYLAGLVLYYAAVSLLDPVPAQSQALLIAIAAQTAYSLAVELRREPPCSMIRREQEKYHWEFLFLGANMDAVTEARRYGIAADRAVRYHNDSRGARLNYEAVSHECAYCETRGSGASV